MRDIRSPITIMSESQSLFRETTSTIRKPLRVLGCLAAAFILAFAPGCKTESGKVKVAVVTNNSESFWKIAEAGATKAATEADVELLFRTPSPGEVATQKEII